MQKGRSKKSTSKKKSNGPKKQVSQMKKPEQKVNVEQRGSKFNNIEEKRTRVGL